MLNVIILSVVMLNVAAPYQGHMHIHTHTPFHTYARTYTHTHTHTHKEAAKTYYKRWLKVGGRFPKVARF
jgi:hypothetical protein